MQSDFDAPGFDKSYAKRQAHGDWLDAMATLAPVEGVQLSMWVVVAGST